MRRSWLFALALLPGAATASAQTSPSPVAQVADQPSSDPSPAPAGKTFSDPADPDAPQVLIEFLLIGGDDLESFNAAGRLDGPGSLTLGPLPPADARPLALPALSVPAPRDLSLPGPGRVHANPLTRMQLATAADPQAAARAASEQVEEVQRLWNEARAGRLGPNIRVLSAPRLTTIVGQQAVVQIQQQAVLDYLEPAGDGLYKRRTTDRLELGLNIKLRVESIDEAARRIRVGPVLIESSTIERRETVPGLSLDVGRPVVTRRSVETSFETAPGRVVMIDVRQSPPVVALVRVDSIRTRN